jgi:hypothetical protein
MSQRTFLGRILANGRTSSELRYWRKKSEFLVFIIQLLGIQSPTNTSSSDVQNPQNRTFTKPCSATIFLRCWLLDRKSQKGESSLGSTGSQDFITIVITQSKKGFPSQKMG